MEACMYGRRMYGSTHVWKFACLEAWIYGCVYAEVYILKAMCMDACMYGSVLYAMNGGVYGRSIVHVRIHAPIEPSE